MENSQRSPSICAKQRKYLREGSGAQGKAEVKTDENKPLPEAATCKGTMAESLWESNSGKLREYKVCLPKTRDISNEASQEASNDEPSKLEQAIIEGERAVMANPNIPQALSTIRNSIDYGIYVRQAQNGAGRA